MTTVPFICAKSGRQLLPEEGGKCGVCLEVMLLRYLRLGVIPRQVAPICVDCERQLLDLGRGTASKAGKSP